MDSRGMGQSSPLNCTEMGDYCSSDWPSTQEEFDANKQCVRDNVEQCYANDPLIKYMDTRSIARDVEAVRQALDDGKLNFFGPSWGSHLATTYLELFPDKVNAMLLDGVLDHIVPPFETLLGFEQSSPSRLQRLRDVVQRQRDLSPPRPRHPRGYRPRHEPRQKQRKLSPRVDVAPPRTPPLRQGRGPPLSRLRPFDSRRTNPPTPPRLR